MNKSTDELINILKSKKSYEDFFREEIGELCFSCVSEYLEILLKEKHMKKNEVIKASNIDKNYAYQLFNGNKKCPSRNKILMLAFAMHLTLEQTRKLLKIAKQSDLYVRDPRDSVIIFCLINNADLFTANESLNEYGLDILE